MGRPLCRSTSAVHWRHRLLDVVKTPEVERRQNTVHLVVASTAVGQSRRRSSACWRVDISPLDLVRDLRVTLDSLLTIKQHVDTVARSCFYQMRQLRSVRRSLTFDALHTLVHALIHSKVDYGNAVLYGAPAKAARRLQAVLNASSLAPDSTSTSL